MFNANTYTYLPSPAKINLFLHICGRYENGYHKLQSLFQILDKGDEIGFKSTPENTIILRDSIAGLAKEDNLIFKAASALLPYKQVDFGIDIDVRKTLPMGGGLGGGSSNAATTLVALNQFWQCGLTEQTLEEIALTLGADVPIFVRGKTAFAQGVGEHIFPAELETAYYLVATPKVHISTADIFNHPDLPRNTPEIEFSDYRFATTTNDCEKLVCDREPKVANLLLWLLHYAPSRMTGTGASVFAVFNDEAMAHAVLGKLPADIKGFVAKGVNQSPLQSRLALL
ncbi:4-(cytidine 5'-diphospho)-2-C-methyl-D-erythritol kinase [Glaciecola sp. XM2]|uniref:4-(cytidine 5'-diphospho)-2-C-methyl-D-erythritol kinase n=1 Tax=Glaciecola sp. XM2 TaxID=1914931 RepID=UPI001BDDE72C|nr:4-(cytidine 5'-diphospho)-2-C-methyl-D-erythritol kinase [Glaciecola sp. XM2]MBT1451020.1 4-(cytidine 5'-diphospho)-2-C-methyl-D-erythritol kinase [Glaciecola sp. XM2]